MENLRWKTNSLGLLDIILSRNSVTMSTRNQGCVTEQHKFKLIDKAILNIGKELKTELSV